MLQIHDTNMIKKEAEKILEYTNLTTEIQLTWNVKTQVMPVIIGATGTIPESFRKYLRNVPEKHEIEELQKTTIMCTGHVRRKVLL